MFCLTHSQWMSIDLDSPSLSKNHRELLSVFYPTITIILNSYVSYVLTHSQWTSLPLCVRPSLFVSGPQIEMMQTNFSGNDWCLLLHAFKVKIIFALLFMCLHSGRWCLLPGFASISSDLNDFGISFDMCR